MIRKPEMGAAIAVMFMLRYWIYQIPSAMVNRMKFVNSQ